MADVQGPAPTGATATPELGGAPPDHLHNSTNRTEQIVGLIMITVQHFDIYLSRTADNLCHLLCGDTHGLNAVRPQQQRPWSISVPLSQL